MGTQISDVKASIELTGSGALQGSIGGSSVNLGPCRIVSINAHLTGADGEILFTTILLLRALLKFI